MFNRLQVDLPLHRVLGPHGAMQVDGRVAAILDLLLSRPGEVVAKDHLVDTVWDRQAVTDDAVAKGVSRARSVLRDAGLEGYSIANVRGVGYRLDIPDDTPASIETGMQPWPQCTALFAVIAVLSQTSFVTWQDELSVPMTIQVGDDQLIVLNPDDPKVRFIDPETGEAKSAREFPEVDSR